MGVLIGFIFLVLLAVIIFVSFVGDITYLKCGMFKGFYHDILGWHMPNDERTSNSVNTHSTCNYCGKDIIRDSQGNWF